ncbi:serine hydrolase domain-containing protein [Desertivirga brevis]|uniref:serine hydrolase domain-containing protein n=1 Tax=Desertivirga brevis TaxID=2810310 RepID=UPI001A9670FD|nr:serine hydrolase [Pedobacter sp. SYSU D00873]
MKRKLRPAKVFYAFLIILSLANILIYATDTTYIYKALIYQQVGIDDLNLFSSREVKKGLAGQKWAQSKQYNKKKLSDTLRKTLEETESVAFLVIKNDSIHYEKYWDGYSDTSLSNPFSVTKSIVGLLVGIAIDEGKINSVEQHVSDFLPEFKEGRKAEITIKHLLQMASGLDFMESYNTPFNYTTESYYGDDLKKLVSKLKVIEAPGSVYRYKSGDTQVLGLILAKATGMTISEYASQKLWQKLGVARSALWSLDKVNGVEKAYCCYYTNAPDLAKIGKLILQNGKFNGEQLISSDYLKASLTPNNLPGTNGSKTNFYGYQWWLLNRNGQVIYCARGLAGQYLMVIPSRNIIIVRLGKKRNREKQGEFSTDILIYADEVVKLFD